MKIVQVIIINVIIVKNPIIMGFFIDDKLELPNQEEENVVLSEKRYKMYHFLYILTKFYTYYII